MVFENRCLRMYLSITTALVKQLTI